MAPVNGALLSPQARVGIFLLAGILLLLLGSFFLGGWKFRWERGKIYYAMLPDAHRIGPETPVELGGVRIGKVERIELDPETHRVVARLRIRPDLKIYKDAVLRIRTSGFLGDRFLELEPGKNQEILPEGSFIPRSTSPLSLEEIFDLLTPVVENIRGVTEDLRKLTGSPELQESITATVQHLERISANLDALVEARGEDLSATIAHLRAITAQLRADLPRLSGELSRGIQSARSTVEELRPAIQRLTERLEKIGANLSEASERVNRILAEVEEGKGTVGTLLKDEKTERNVRDTAEALGNLARSYRDLRTVIEYRGQIENLPELSRRGIRHTMNIRIQPKPEKYYALGIVRAPTLVETRTVRRTTTQDPRTGTTITETTTQELVGEERILFNLYLARTFFSFVTVRGGILESSGGVGLDLHLYPEVWDLRSELFRFPLEGGKPYWRAWSELRLFRHLTLTAGFENLLTPPQSRRYSVGAGIIFDDEDLKTLFLALPRISF